MKHGAANISKLSVIISNSLIMHSSDKRLKTLRKLFQSALAVTDFKPTISNKNFSLAIKLIEVSNAQTSCKEDLIVPHVLCSIGVEIQLASASLRQTHKTTCSVLQEREHLISDSDPKVPPGTDRVVGGITAASIRSHA
jgi:hypothetical protein